MLARVDWTDLRLQYMRTGLDEASADADPLALFQRWLQEATDAGLPLPGSMTLATTSAGGAPTARSLILRGLDERGFVFLTNYRSRKGKELDADPRASLLFLWSPLERQVRVDGTVNKISDDESEEFYATRPLDVRLEAWASTQSQPAKDRAELETNLAAARERFGDNPPRPPHWGGYRLTPHSYEFWQGREDRIHDRLLYTRSGAEWRLQRLAP
jgi:pyridoxamine 5'-phosphate oxidase